MTMTITTNRIFHQTGTSTDAHVLIFRCIIMTDFRKRTSPGGTLAAHLSAAATTPRWRRRRWGWLMTLVKRLSQWSGGDHHPLAAGRDAW